MAELLSKEPLFNGKAELDQLDKVNGMTVLQSYEVHFLYFFFLFILPDIQIYSKEISAFFDLVWNDMQIFRILGTPNETIWPGCTKLPGYKVNFVKHQ